ncbi:hypothetical protein [Pseudomonas denitrificans (nom. rej.)]|uniref:hypothetical protein n=1 Tax=Pseudomonas denitrificans TaxID=43306 RepID=UPI001E5B2FAC|nr:hypothetical protein [Pseudomonas denitrificans (nom. rej.)]
MKPGDKASLEVIRDNKRQTLSLTIGSLRTTTMPSPQSRARVPSAAATAWV